MKFKTKEELYFKDNMGIHHIHNSAIDKAFNSFKERIDFYQKHIDPDLTEDDFYFKWEDENHHISWEYWLFQYCFGDIE